MASTSSKVWLTLAAAVGTLVIASVVVSAPSVQRCQGQEDGLWSCLRGELIEFGLLRDETPIPAAAAVETNEPAPLVPAEPPPAEVALPAVPVETPAVEIAEPQTLEPLPLDEPAPASEPVEATEPAFELPSGPPMATAPTEPAELPEPPTSARAAAPAEPLPTDPASAEAAVALPETEASPVAPALQPRAAADGATGIVADAAIAPDLSQSPIGVALAPSLGIRIALGPEPLRLLPPATTLAPPALAHPEPEPDPEPEPEVAVAPAQPEVAVEPPATAALEFNPPAEAPALSPAPLADASVPEPSAEAGPEPVPPAAPEPPPGPTLIASATASISPGARAAIAPTIDAVEIDGSSSFVAGAGRDGTIVDLYVGQRYVGSAEVEGGRWVFQVSGAIAVDQLRVALAPQAQGRAWLGTRSILSFNVAPTGVRLVGTEAAAELLQVQPDSELELTPANPTLQAFISVDPELLRFRSGKAIIRRGDTLWAIARRVYGRGALYPVIFAANRDQIRSPGRIYPGQVLTLPRAD